MALKVVARETLNKAEADVARLQRGVDFYKEVVRGGKDGIKAALELIKKQREDAIRLKNYHLLNPSPVRAMKAVGYANQEEAFNFVITLFEDPKVQMSAWEDALQRAKQFVKKLNDLDVREDDEKKS